MRNDDACFILSIPTFRNTPHVIIYAYDDMSPGWDNAGRVRITCEVVQGGQIIFPKGQLYCALHGSSDSDDAKKLVLSLVAMRPGDTDADYFTDYTPAQLAWAVVNGETLTMVAYDRYGED